MRFKFINRSNKKRSSKTKEHIAMFAAAFATELGIYDDIDQVIFTYKPDFANNYYPEGKPMAGFKYLYNNGIVRIDFTRHWDYGIQGNLEAIVHEFTHVRQMVSGDLEIGKDLKSVKWKGKTNHTWKQFRESIMESIDDVYEQRRYLKVNFPWEVEVQRNLTHYLEGYE